MNEAGRRATRTFLQGIPAGLLIAAWQAFAPPSVQMNPTQVAALMPILTAVTSLVMNLLEDAGTIPTVVPKAS